MLQITSAWICICLLRAPREHINTRDLIEHSIQSDAIMTSINNVFIGNSLNFCRLFLIERFMMWMNHFFFIKPHSKKLKRVK